MLTERGPRPHPDDAMNENEIERQEGSGTDFTRDLRQWAAIEGFHNPEVPWFLSDRDTWEENPHYTGAPVPHPEDYEWEAEELSETVVLVHPEFEIHFTKLDGDLVNVEFGKHNYEYEFWVTQAQVKPIEDARDLWRLSLKAGWVRAGNRLQECRVIPAGTLPGPSPSDLEGSPGDFVEGSCGEFENYCMNKA